MSAKLLPSLRQGSRGTRPGFGGHFVPDNHRIPRGNMAFLHAVRFNFPIIVRLNRPPRWSMILTIWTWPESNCNNLPSKHVHPDTCWSWPHPISEGWSLSKRWRLEQLYKCRFISTVWLQFKVLNMASHVLGIVVAAALLASTNAQTFQRLGACPTFGCVFPPDQWVSNWPRFPRLVFDKDPRTDFLAGQFFDIRLEVHAPVNGSEANGGVPDPNFTFSITKDGSTQPASTYFGTSEPTLERWNFTWYEGTWSKLTRC